MYRGLAHERIAKHVQDGKIYIRATAEVENLFLINPEVYVIDLKEIQI